MGLFHGYASDAEIDQRAGLMENLSILAHAVLRFKRVNLWFKVIIPDFKRNCSILDSLTWV